MVFYFLFLFAPPSMPYVFGVARSDHHRSVDAGLMLLYDII